MSRSTTGTTYRVGELARLAKVTVRTLHHYDEIGLLRPSGRNGAGYRLYAGRDLERLVQIRLHRELGMPLEVIRELLDAPGFDPAAALREHRRQLVQRLRETESLVATIDRMLDARGDREMNAEDLFDGFRQEDHEAEAQQRWGDSPAWHETRRRTSAYGPDQWRAIKAEADAIVASFAALLASGADPASAEATALADQHREHIGRWFYPCSSAMHAGLAEMYVSDERFTATFDRHGEGLAAFVAAAIKANAAGA